MITASLPPGSYSHHAPTSLAAASRVAEETTATQNARILRALSLSGINGCTRDELQTQCKMSGDSVRPRCKSLMARKLVELSDEIRPTAKGRSAEVLILTDAGRRVMSEVP